MLKVLHCQSLFWNWIEPSWPKAAAVYIVYKFSAVCSNHANNHKCIQMHEQTIVCKGYTVANTEDQAALKCAKTRSCKEAGFLSASDLLPFWRPTVSIKQCVTVQCKKQINHHVLLLSQTLTNNELCLICVPHWHSPRILHQVPQCKDFAPGTARKNHPMVGQTDLALRRHSSPVVVPPHPAEMLLRCRVGSRFFHFLRGLLPKKHGSNPHYCKVLERIAPPNLQARGFFLVLKIDNTKITWETIRPWLQLPKVQ